MHGGIIGEQGFNYFIRNRNIICIATECCPTEGAFAEAEEGADVSGDEAGEGKAAAGRKAVSREW